MQGFDWPMLPHLPDREGVRRQLHRSFEDVQHRSGMRMRRLIQLLMIGALCGGAACGSADWALDEAAWSASSVNGRSLPAVPFVINGQNDSIDVLAGQLTFSHDRQFVQYTRVIVNRFGAAQRDTSALSTGFNYELKGDSLIAYGKMLPDARVTFGHGLRTGNTLTMRWFVVLGSSAETWVYRRAK